MRVKIQHSILNKPTASADIDINIDEEIPIENNIVGVFGESGAGKSTLLKVMAGLLIRPQKLLKHKPTTQYEFCWQQTDIINVKGKENPCVYVGESTPLFEHLSVRDNIDIVDTHVQHNAQTFHFTKLTKADVIARCRISDLMTKNVNQLSSGEKQRVNFARALLSAKPILLLDEAFSALDWQTRLYMQSVLINLVEHHGYSCMLVSHSLRELSACCQFLWQISDGKLLRKGETEKVLADLMGDTANATSNPAAAYFSVVRAFFISDEQDDNGLQIWSLCCNAYDSCKNYETCKRDANSATNMTETQDQQSAYNIYVKSSALSTKTHQHYIDDASLNSASEKAIHTFIINADAVSISINKPLQSSMLNTLPAEVSAINKTEAGVVISLSASNQIIRSLITRKSCLVLNLQVGDSVFAVFKALDTQIQD